VKIQIEDERKFLVFKADLQGLKNGVETTQGYLWLKPPVRVRFENFLDCILITKLKLAPGVNVELGGEIPFSWGNRLIRHHKYHKVRKIRYRIGRWELDIFLGELTGLVLLEFEKKFRSELAPLFPINVPDFMEVTGDTRFENHNLCRLEKIPEEWRCEIVSGNL
jgi:CYTH domain-containing protein